MIGILRIIWIELWLPHYFEGEESHDSKDK